MNPSESRARALREQVHLVPYDLSWPAAFRRERERLMRSLPGVFIDIRHIGSTAVPGVVAKPVIDLIGGLRGFDALEETIARLGALGYAYEPDAAPQSDDRKWLFLHEQGRRTHHLHLVVHGSRAWRDRVLFCERLNADPDLRARYEALKLQLQARTGADRDAYTEGKGEFIRAAIADPD